MKKSGIMNAELVGALAELRHQDKLVICDAGFPVPAGGYIVDVSLVSRVPTFMQVLKAVCNEMIFEKYVVFDMLKDFNKAYYKEITEAFVKQEHEEVGMPEFIEMAKDAKLFIRTPETWPCSNILLVSASGAELPDGTYLSADLDVKFDEI